MLLFGSFEFLLEYGFIIFAIVSIAISFVISFFLSSESRKKDREVFQKHNAELKKAQEEYERITNGKREEYNKLSDVEKEILKINERFEYLFSCWKMEIQERNDNLIITSQMKEYNSNSKQINLNKKYIPVIINILRDKKLYSDWEVELEEKVDFGIIKVFFEDFDRGRQEISIELKSQETNEYIVIPGNEIFRDAFIKKLLKYVPSDVMAPLPNELTLEEYKDEILKAAMIKKTPAP